MAKKTKPKHGINKTAYLARNLFNEKKLEMVPTRNGYGDGLVEAGKKNKNVVVLCADLSESTRSQYFKDAYPERYVQIGVSEQSMAAIAAGLALGGKVPFISSYAAFSPGRNWEQIRTTIALQNVPVKVGGAHAGISVGPDGATHQPVEDIAIMRAMPNMRVSVPCDQIETRKATSAIAKLKGPDYIRFAREKSPVFTTEKTPYKFGRAELYRHGSDVTIIGAGPLLYQALVAAQNLSHDHGIECRVINMHTVKPLDEKAIIAAAKETGAIVTVEEANVLGGLGGAVAETVSAHTPVPVERVGVMDRFGESGAPNELLEALGLTAPYIAMAAIRVLHRKQGKRVPANLMRVRTAEEKEKKMKEDVIKEALSRTPKKWGGKKPDSSLKSRQKAKK